MLVASNTVKTDLIKRLALPDVVPMTVDGKVFFGESVRTLVNTKYNFSFLLDVSHPVAELDDEGVVYTFTGFAVQRAFASDAKNKIMDEHKEEVRQQEAKIQELRDEVVEIVSSALTPKVFVNDTSNNISASKNKGSTTP